MTSNRVKAAARRLQTSEGIPYAEARRRVLAELSPSPSSNEPLTRRLEPRPHRCLGPMYTAGTGDEREKFCPRCATPELRDRVAAVDQAARQLRIVTRDSGSDFGWHRLTWPYGPNIDLDSREALVDWAGPLGLRQSTTYNKCLHWLRGRQCPRGAGYGACGATVPGADHLSVWNRGPGRTPAAVVSQPYHLSDEDFAELAELAKERDLVVEVDENGGWYGAGTIWVAIWNAARHPSASVTA